MRLFTWLQWHFVAMPARAELVIEITRVRESNQNCRCAVW